jgi:UDP-N-acetylmuramate-alanine ligase
MPAAVLEQACAGDVVVVMGAGSIGTVAQRVVDLAGGAA